METISHSYCHGRAEVPLQFWRSFDRLPLWASRTPDKEMVVFRRPDSPRESVTFAEFHRLTDGIAGRLIREHPELSVGARVLLMGGNSLEFCAVFAGLHKAGLVPVMVHPQRQEDVQNWALRTDSRAAFYQPVGIYLTAADWLRDRLELRLDLDTLIGLGRETAEATAASDSGLQELLRQRQAEISADQTFAIYLTSGTTGEPKMVPHSHHSVVNTVRFRTLGAFLTNEDVFFSDRPTGHMVGSFGLLMAMLEGLTLVATPTSAFSGDRGAKNAAWLLSVLAEERATSGDFFGYLVHDILQKGGRPPPTLRSALLSGALTTGRQMERAMSALPGLVNYYGSTETGVISEICAPWGLGDDQRARRDTVGRPAPHMEVMVTDPAGRDRTPLPVGATGELWVRGYSVMRGYLDDPDRSRETLTEAGWFRTGDLGSMDQNGRLTVTSRIKDLIIRAAENIMPSCIEQVLLGHPDVHAAQVFGVPDERYGEEIATCVVLREERRGGRESELRTAQELAEWCYDRGLTEGRSGLSIVPRFWAFLSDFPTGPTGKVTKSSVREAVTSGCGFIDGLEFLVVKGR